MLRRAASSLLASTPLSRGLHLLLCAHAERTARCASSALPASPIFRARSRSGCCARRFDTPAGVRNGGRPSLGVTRTDAVTLESDTWGYAASSAITTQSTRKPLLGSSCSLGSIALRSPSRKLGCGLHPFGCVEAPRSMRASSGCRFVVRCPWPASSSLTSCT